MFQHIVLTMLLVSAGCAARSSGVETSAPASRHEVPPVGNVRDVRSADRRSELLRSLSFENYVYPLPQNSDSGGSVNVALKSGSWEGVLDQRETHARLVSVGFGDVTGDQAEEAIIVLALDSEGGAGTVRYAGFVVGAVSGEAQFLWSHLAGSRADKGLRRLSAQDGMLLVESYLPTSVIVGGKPSLVGLCCPEQYRRTFLVWRSNGFEQAREEVFENPSRTPDLILGED